MPVPIIKVQADFSGTAFGGSPTWTDITAYVLLDPGDSPIKVTWGRQDEESQVQPRSCSFTLDNSDGRFTPDSTTPVYSNVDIGVRVRVSVTVDGFTYNRFDGNVSDWDAGYDGTALSGKVEVTAVDLTARMSTLLPLRAMVIEEMLLDAPTALYPLGEAAGATSAGDITGKNDAAQAVSSKYGAGTLAFGSDTTILGASGAVAMTSPDSGSATVTARGTYLSVPNALPASGAFSVTVGFLGPAAHPTPGLENLFYLPNRAFGGPGVAYCHITSSGTLTSSINGATVTLTATSTSDVCDGKWHVLVLTLSADGKSWTLSLDGASQGVGTNATDIAWTNPGTPFSLGMLVARATVEYPLSGSLALFGQYGTALSSTRILAHYTAATTGFAGEGTGARISRLLSYRPNTGTSLATGKGTAGVQDTTDAALLDAVQQAVAAEGGVQFVDGAGAIRFLNRATLYDPAVAVTLDANKDQVDAGVRFRKDDQDLTNDVTYSRAGGATVRTTNATSIGKYGYRAVSETLYVNSDRDVMDAAGWRLARQKSRRSRVPDCYVDLVAETSGATIAAVLNAAPWSVLSLTNVPGVMAPASTVNGLIEGGTEDIGVTVWDVSFYTTPMPPGTLRADAAASANTKLDFSGLVIPW